MAAPTAPTLTTLTTEALKRAGYSDPANYPSGLLTRAQDEWMADIKNDVWRDGRVLRSMKSIWIKTTTNGVSKYSLPTDFYRMQGRIQMMHGANYGTAQAGGASSVTLAADETADSTWIIGREIVIYAGTGIGQIAQVSAYDSTTKVATISPAWTTQPVNGDSYMIIDEYFTLNQKQDADFMQLTDPGDYASPPREYFVEEDADYGNIIFDQPPYDANAPWIIRAPYYANLLTLDLAGTLMSTLYHKWRNLWIQGCFAKALQDMDDDRAIGEMRIYFNILERVLKREKLDTGGHVDPHTESCF